MRLAFLAAIPLAAALPSPAALAQSAAGSAPAAQVPAVDAAYLRFYDAIVGGVDMGQMAIGGADSIFDGLVRNQPKFADVARRNPGLKGEFRTATLPFLKMWMDRSTAAMRGKVAARLAKYFTVAEAEEVAQFYGSPLGKKFLKAVSESMSFDTTVDQAISGGKPEAGIAGADMDKSANRAMARLLPTLTADEREALMRFSQRPVFRKLALIDQAMAGMEQPSMDEFSTAEERDAFGKAVRDLFIRATSSS